MRCPVTYSVSHVETIGSVCTLQVRAEDASPLRSPGRIEQATPSILEEWKAPEVCVENRPATEHAGLVQYESAVVTSAPCRVPKAHHVIRPIELLMNFTLPSANKALTPPG
jgi:hypothetical protein